jgi:hypothetical protein
MKKRADWRWVWAAGIFMAVVTVALRLGNDEVKWVAAGLLASSAIAFFVWYLKKWTDWWWAGTAGIFVVMVTAALLFGDDEVKAVAAGLLVLSVLTFLVRYLYREVAKRRKEAHDGHSPSPSFWRRKVDSFVGFRVSLQTCLRTRCAACDFRQSVWLMGKR